MKATFVTVADSQYFLGLVALLNSLRLTGNEGELIVIDCGLTKPQRALLSGTCRLPAPLGRRLLARARSSVWRGRFGSGG